MEPRLAAGDLRELVLAARRRVRAAWKRVTAAGTIAALEDD